jgi:hypothetical protein
VGDVANGIVDLALVEGTAGPVGEARALVERVAEDALDEVRIADLLAVAQGHGRNLRIEHRRRHLLGHVMDDLEVLPAGVEDLEHLVVADQQVEQGREVEPGSKRVDGRRLVRGRDLSRHRIGQ